MKTENRRTFDLSLGEVLVSTGWASPGVPGAAARYGPKEGFPELRLAIARLESVPVHAVCITAGASMALTAAFAMLKKPGAVLLPRPYFPHYKRLADYFGLESIFYDVSSKPSWSALDAISKGLKARVRAVIVNSPGNPIGNSIEPIQIHEIARICTLSNILTISDEVYSDFSYDMAGAAFPKGWMDLSLMRVKSFSKAFSIPGERVGYALAPQSLIPLISAAHWELAMSVSISAQMVAATLLMNGAPGHIPERRRLLLANRDEAVRLLKKTSAVFTIPGGGVFLWLTFPNLSVSGHKLAADCAYTTGVASVPGEYFGYSHQAALRFSFALPREDVREAFSRLSQYFSRL